MLYGMLDFDGDMRIFFVNKFGKFLCEIDRTMLSARASESYREVRESSFDVVSNALADDSGGVFEKIVCLVISLKPF